MTTIKGRKRVCMNDNLSVTRPPVVRPSSGNLCPNEWMLNEWLWFKDTMLLKYTVNCCCTKGINETDSQTATISKRRPFCRDDPRPFCRINQSTTRRLPRHIWMWHLATTNEWMNEWMNESAGNNKTFVTSFTNFFMTKKLEIPVDTCAVLSQ